MNVRIVCLNHPVNSLNPTPCGVQIMFSARKLFLKKIWFFLIKKKKVVQSSSLSKSQLDPERPVLFLNKVSKMSLSWSVPVIGIRVIQSLSQFPLCQTKNNHSAKFFPKVFISAEASTVRVQTHLSHSWKLNTSIHSVVSTPLSIYSELPLDIFEIQNSQRHLLPFLLGTAATKLLLSDVACKT